MTNPKVYIEALVDAMRADAAITAHVHPAAIRAFHQLHDERSIFEHLPRMVSGEIVVFYEGTLPPVQNDRHVHQLAIAVMANESRMLDIQTAVYGLKIGTSPAEFWLNPRSLHPDISKIQTPTSSRRTSERASGAIVDYLQIQLSLFTRC